jgi:hypothetical protein
MKGRLEQGLRYAADAKGVHGKNLRAMSQAPLWLSQALIFVSFYARN